MPCCDVLKRQRDAGLVLSIYLADVGGKSNVDSMVLER